MLGTSLNLRIIQLENEIINLTAKLEDLSKNTEEKYKTPISIVGGGRDRGAINPIDIKAGMGQILGGSLIWNTSELGNPPINDEPPVPDENTGKGYNKHTHSRFSGGALIKDVIEIVEYDFDSTPIANKHSQQFWQEQPKIKKEINSKIEQVDKIGLLDLVFNPDTKTWGCPAYEIDIKKCYLVERDISGVIALDSKGQEKKSPLYNEDQTKTSIIWDESGNCWRFLAVYAEGN
jgi:hypothetical protein